ncbi:hypothetical protein SDC9_171366 [bioreactor metagenome]|uniref:Uncharacterized protein n=1 Tax=bioreactor metagenome TaxID=1076179 RepID=A0A645GJT3_9ZZZZ
MTNKIKPVRVSPVVILPRGNNVVDVFVGGGWEQHSVFQVSAGGFPKLVKGSPLTQEQYNFLREQVQ